MEGGRWDKKEIKRLRKKQLIQSNLIFLLLFVSYGIYIELGGSSTVLLGITSAILWLLLANMFFTLRTGKVIGTKAMQRVQAFDRDCLGESRWKRRMIIGAVILFALSAGATVALFVMDMSTVTLDFYQGSFAFIGAWLGMNTGEIHRIRKLSREFSEESSDKHGSSESL